jgi:hypothetical protein
MLEGGCDVVHRARLLPRIWLRTFHPYVARKYSSLLIVLLLLPLAQALADGYPVLELAYGVGLVGMIVVALVTVGRTRHALWAALALGLPSIAAVVALPTTGFNVDHHALVLVLLRTVVVLSLLVLLVVEILRDVLHTRQVLFDQVCGGLCVYLMIGFAWGLVYAAMLRIEPTSFVIDRDRFGLIQDDSPHHLAGVMTYFSFICLTTLGFGDVTPASPLARGLVCIEAVLSQIYMAVFVARLVSQYLASGAVTVTIDTAHAPASNPGRNPRSDPPAPSPLSPHVTNHGRDGVPSPAVAAATLEVSGRRPG